jgi:hypothetical protein
VLKRAQASKSHPGNTGRLEIRRKTDLKRMPA